MFFNYIYNFLHNGNYETTTDHTIEEIELGEINKTFVKIHTVVDTQPGHLESRGSFILDSNHILKRIEINHSPPIIYPSCNPFNIPIL